MADLLVPIQSTSLKSGDKARIVIQTPEGDTQHVITVLHRISEGMPDNQQAFTFTADQFPDTVVIAVYAEFQWTAYGYPMILAEV